MNEGKDFNIKITGDPTSINRASRDAAEGLGELKEKGVESNKSVGEETEKLTLKKHDLKHIIQHIKEEFPLLAIAGQLAIMPLIGVVSLLLMGFKKCTEEIEEFHKQLSRKADLSSLAGQTQGVRDALTESRIETEGIFDGLNRVLDAQKSWKEVCNETVGRLSAEHEAIERVFEAQKKLAVAQLEAYRATHPGSDAAVDKAKFEYEEKYDAAARKRADAYEQEQIKQKINAKTGTESEMSVLGPMLPGYSERAKLAENKAKQIEENLKRARENFSKQRDLIAGTEKEPGLQDKLNEISGQLAPGDTDILSRFGSVEEFRKWAANQPSKAPIGGDTMIGEKWVELNAKLQEERSRERGLGGKVKELESEVEPSKKIAASTKKDEEDIRKRLDEDGKDLKSLEDEIKRLQAEHRLKHDERETLGAIEKESRRVERTSKSPFNAAATADVSEGVGIAKAARAHKPVTQEDASHLMDIAGAIAGHQVSFQQAVGMLSAAEKNMNVGTGYVVKLAEAMERMAQEHSRLSSYVNEQVRRIDSQLKDSRNRQYN